MKLNNCLCATFIVATLVITGQSVAGLAEWTGTAKIWTDTQCPNLGDFSISGRVQCQGFCKLKKMDGCTAINYSSFYQACSLRKCGNVVPPPEWDKELYDGYYFTPEEWTMTEKVWSDVQCPTNGRHPGPTLAQCKQLCGDRKGCTAINYNSVEKYCVLRKCGWDVPAPELELDQYYGYYHTPPAVNCVWAQWTEWSKCNKSCEGGTKTRTRTKKVEARHGGKECPGSSSDSSQCNNIPCTACLTDNARKPCKFPFIYEGKTYIGCTKDGHIDDQWWCSTLLDDDGWHVKGRGNWGHCKLACPKHQDCKWASWTAWSSCKKSCEEGTKFRSTKTRSRKKQVEAQNGGDVCLGKSKDTKPCKSIPCPVNCVWAQWTAWSSCNKSCEGGTKTRFRTKQVEAEHGGKECPGDSSDTTKCNSIPCRNIVNCNFTVDNSFGEISYNGRVLDVTGQQGGPWDWAIENSFQFTPDSPTNGAGELRLEELRNKQYSGHCLSAGLLLYCKATDTTSPWHNFKSDMTHWRAEDSSNLCSTGFEPGSFTRQCFDGEELKTPLPDKFFCRMLKDGAIKIWTANREVTLIGSPDINAGNN